MEFSMRATDDTFNDNSMKGLVLGVRKPGAFEFHYDVGEQAPSMRMETSCSVQDKNTRLRLKHHTKPKPVTSLEAAVDVNDSNKAIVVMDLSNWDGADLKRCTMKWRYTKDDLSIEPGYNFGSESVFVDARYRMDDENRLRAVYEHGNKNAMLEWTNTSGMGGGGAMKMSASMCMDDGMKKMPTLRVQKDWDLDF
jgi:hypothetical protein